MLACCFLLGCRNSLPADVSEGEVSTPARAEGAARQRLRPVGGVAIAEVKYLPANDTSDPVLEAAILRQFSDYRYCGTNPQRAIRYLYNRVDLNGDEMAETLVYLVGRETCGSGGCTVVIFRSTDDHMLPITQLTVVQPRIVISSGTSHGWRDLVAYVAGGGAEPGYHLLQYTGSTYPQNPSVAPRLPAGSEISGEAYFNNEASGAHMLRGPSCGDGGTSVLEGERLGSLQIGLDGSRVIEILGLPASKGTRVRSEADALDHQSWRYRSEGVTIDMVFDADHESPAIASLRINGASDLKTKRGVGIGSSYAEVEEAYRSEKNEEASQEPMTFVAGSSQEGLVFSFEDGHVAQIFLGATSE